ncbi:MAG: sec-independent translocase [Jatrophihabitantaceae bacterium]
MFNVGPLELMVLAIVGLIVLGPDRLPGLAKDAARMLKTLREMANGARTQLRDELGPEFADIDLRNLNPRTALQRVVLGDEDFSSLNPKAFLDGILADEPTVSLTKDEPVAPARQGRPPTQTASVQTAQQSQTVATPVPRQVKPVSRPRPQPLARNESAPFDSDAT